MGALGLFWKQDQASTSALTVISESSDNSRSKCCSTPPSTNNTMNNSRFHRNTHLRHPASTYYVLFLVITMASTIFAKESALIDNTVSEGMLRVAPVGKIFTLANDNAKSSLIIEALPKWLTATDIDVNKTTATPGRQFVGIPQPENVGDYVLVDEQGNLEAIKVVEETLTECDDGMKTSWIEILHNENLEDLSTLDQIQWVNRTFEALRLSLKDLLDNGREDFRVLKLSYLPRYRIIDKTIHDAFDASIDPKRAVLVLNISCGELTQYAMDLINAVADISTDFRVVSGELNSLRPALRTTTTVPYKATRTTRQIYDNRPVALNQLSIFHCKKGVLCRLDVGENTFMDAEDGSTSKLRLFVHPIDETATTSFLVSISRSTHLEGVPLTTGTFHFRVEARDHLNQTVSLPFRVDVDDSPEANHAFAMTLDITLDKFNSRRAETLRDFVYQLGAALRGYERNENDAKMVRVETLAETGPSQVTIRWANASLSRRVCQERAINDTRAQMLFGRNYDRVRHDFRRSLSSFYVKKITLEMKGVCALTAATKANILSGFKIRATTTETSVDAEPAGALVESLMIPLILLAILLLFVTLLTIFYCMHVKNRQQRKKKQQQGEYITKGGFPIVFPQEVPHDEEDAVIGVTTPMLVAREQPPLDPARMTLHENPLYKPPPTAQATLRQVGGSPSSATGALASAPNPTSTFSTPAQASGFRQSPFHGSSGGGSVGATPRAPIGAVGQRSPPPYTAAI